MHPSGTRTRTAIVVVLLAVLMASGYMNARTDGMRAPVAEEIPVVRIVSQAPVQTPDVPVGETASPQMETLEALTNQREAMRIDELAMLDGIIADAQSGEEILAQAQQQKLALIERMENESALETVLRAGCSFSDVLVCMTASSVTVFVGAQTLSQEQLTQILDFTIRETGQTPENIKILARK